MTDEGERVEQIEVNGEHYFIQSSVYGQLYSHQQIGLKWLLGLFQKREGGLLCDEMGLGKTVTVIAFLSCLNTTLAEYQKAGKELPHRTLRLLSENHAAHLLITPVTIMKQWKSELMAWDPANFTAQNVWILHESADPETREKTIRKAIRTRGVLIASYELVRMISGSFIRNEWGYIILDEGQKIKNPTAQISQVCQRLKSINRIVLTGTPIQNSVRELWSLFDFACPGFLGDLRTFEKDFCGQIIRGSMADANGDVKDAAHRCTCVLRSLIVPRILRRTRKEVSLEPRPDIEPGLNPAPILPAKKEYVLYCSMGAEQAALYRIYIAYKNLPSVLANYYKSFKEGMFAGIIHLRKLANHPDLLFGTDPQKFVFAKEMYGTCKEYLEFTQELKKELQIGEPADNPQNEDSGLPSPNPVIVDSALRRKALAKVAARHWQLSFKFVLLKKMIKKWKREKRKALIFTQTRKLLDIIEEFVKDPDNNCSYLRLDGQTPVKQRMPIVDRFNTDPGIDLFLLTTKVGGVGINLTGATRVLIFEPDWNPMSDAQAKDRAVRIGQLNEVVIYRIILANCIEEKIYHRQLFKEFLARKVLRDPFLEKSFSYKDLYDFFDKEADGSDHSFPPGTLLQKRKIDTETSRETAGDLAKFCLKKRYVKQLEKDYESVVKQAAQSPAGEEDKAAEPKPKKKEGKKGRGKRKRVKDKEQELLMKVFAEDDEVEPKRKTNNRIAEKVLGRFEEARLKRAREMKQDIGDDFFLSHNRPGEAPEEEVKVRVPTPEREDEPEVQEKDKENEQPEEEEKDAEEEEEESGEIGPGKSEVPRDMRLALLEYFKTNKSATTAQIMEHFDKYYKAEKFDEFKQMLQTIAKLSASSHTWSVKASK